MWDGQRRKWTSELSGLSCYYLTTGRSPFSVLLAHRSTVPLPCSPSLRHPGICSCPKALEALVPWNQQCPQPHKSFSLLSTWPTPACFWLQDRGHLRVYLFHGRISCELPGAWQLELSLTYPSLHKPHRAWFKLIFNTYWSNSSKKSTDGLSFWNLVKTVYIIIE